MACPADARKDIVSIKGNNASDLVPIMRRDESRLMVKVMQREKSQIPDRKMKREE
jgi:hypothetical protein